ncbi:hypothetical protein [Ruminococcus flavefaciens]|uniref:hypothetical protein n=1 Tax=Ruminococcus flavefaciens TaxID=1265 RepID=UPI0004913095|nr:hypothetical protein [Ruminococcus flavefaciens]
MVEQDTIKLLRECDSGVKMGISSINDVLDYVSSEELRGILQKSSDEHESIKTGLQKLLSEYRDDGKEPAAIAKGMSWIKTSVMLKMNESDSTVADLMTDGCNMGVKSLSRYLNKYAAADERSKDMAKKLIRAEECLAADVRPYL